MTQLGMKIDQKNPEPKNVRKTDGDRVADLTHSASIIRDALELYAEGRLYQLGAVSAQLRILLADKEPLLNAVADLSGSSLHVHTGKVKSATFDTGQHSLHLPPISADAAAPSDTQHTLAAFLDLTVIQHPEGSESNRTLIRIYADKLGGAHSDSTTPRHIAYLREADNRSLDKYLASIGSVALSLCSKVLETHLDFTVHLSFALVSSTGASALLEIGEDQSKSRLGIFLEPSSQLRLEICGLDGSLHRFRLLEKIAPSERCIITITGKVEENGFFSLHAWANGRQTINAKLHSFPLFINQLDKLPTKLHHSEEVTDGDSEFIMFRLLTLSRSLNQHERHALYQHSLAQAFSSPAVGVYFFKGTKGYSCKHSINGDEVNAMKLDPVGKAVDANQYLKLKKHLIEH